MTGGESESDQRSLVNAALCGEEPSWVTLAPDVPWSSALDVAIERFDAGSRSAGKAATRWLREEARLSILAARTHLLVGSGRVLAFYALASAQVLLSQRDRRRVGLDPTITPASIPATLVAWIARAQSAGVRGETILLHVAANARRVDRIQSTTVIVVDPFDAQTANMWQQRYGFRRAAGGRGRLWLPVRN